MSETKERPIRLYPHEVLAILDGRKTQTRRVVKLPRGFDVNCYPRDKCGLDRVGVNADGMLELRVQTAVDDDEIHLFACPYGKPGDVLWGKETWATYYSDDEFLVGDVPIYRADYEGDPSEVRWSPSTHMPRCASRIDLEVTGVRVERAQDISGRDVLACGIDNGHSNPTMGVRWENMQQIAYIDFLTKVHGAGSWDRNDWVWVVEFKKGGA